MVTCTICECEGEGECVGWSEEEMKEEGVRVGEGVRT